MRDEKREKLKPKAPPRGGRRPEKGEPVVYFPVRAAIARLGGINETARTLGISKATVAAWVAPTRRSRPDDETLATISRLSGVALESLELYYHNLMSYRANELFRRRRPQ